MKIFMDDARNPGSLNADLPSGDMPEALQPGGDTMPPTEVVLGAVAVNGDPAQDNDSLLSSEETESIPISDNDLSLVETFLKGPVALGEIRLHLSQLDLTADDFSVMREDLVKKLESHGVAAGWKKVGQGAGAYYTLEIISGSEAIEEAVRQREELRQQEAQRREEARISKERDMEQVAQLDEKRREKVLSRALIAQTFQKPEVRNQIVELLRQNGAASINRIANFLFKTPRLKLVDEKQLQKALEGMIQSGLIVYMGKGQYRASRAKPPKSTSSSKPKTNGSRKPTVTYLNGIRQRNNTIF